MKEFEFTIKFSLGDADADPESYGQASLKIVIFS
jgi:hypothetical protein